MQTMDFQQNIHSKQKNEYYYLDGVHFCVKQEVFNMLSSNYFQTER